MRRIISILGIFLMALGLMSNVIISPTAHATAVDPGWLGDGSVQYKDIGNVSPYPKRCKTEYRKISPIVGHVYTTLDPTPDIQVCVYKNKGFQYAEYQREFYIDPSWKSFGTRMETSIAFADNDGAVMVPARVQIDASTLDRTYTGEDSDIFIRQERGANYALTLMLYHNPLTNMKIDDSGWLFFASDADYSLKTSQGSIVNNASALGTQVSTDGKYLVFAVENAGYGYIDLQTFKGHLFTNSFKTSPDVWPVPVPTLAISSGARYVVVGGMAVATRVYTMGPCGLSFDENIYLYALLQTKDCSYRDLTAETYSHSRAASMYGYRYFLDVHISDRGDSFSYYDYEKWSTIYAPNYLPPESMDYIALGDSYSSGEGDFYHPEGSHYLPFTNILGNYKDNIPRELCHVSDRSYPFLLANDMGVARGKDMQSVACSGAVRSDVLSTGFSDGIDLHYLGQSIPIKDNVVLPRLQPLSGPGGFQLEAQADFIPGRVQQVDFIKRNHPKVATIGISGNDIGFAAILQACLFNNPFDTCEYATPDGLQDLANILQDNYNKQVAFYTQLKKASPGTDFYAVGYPQFINDDKLMCWSLDNALNQQERAMIRASVSYLNETIRNAASTAGIKYIDIEHALEGGTMCGKGSEGVSHPITKTFYGLLTLDLFDFADKDTVADSLTPAEDYIYQQLNMKYRASSDNLLFNPVTAAMIAAAETFHPNAAGHEMIYKYIHDHQNGTSLLDDTCDNIVIFCPDAAYNTLPSILPDFGNINQVATQIASLAQDSTTGNAWGIGATVERGSKIRLNVDAIVPQLPVSIMSAKLSLHSDSIELGSPTVESGSIVSSVYQIPFSTQPGFHELVLELKLANGEESKLIQPLFIVGSPDDIDGDGIQNNVDTCEFLTPSVNDVNTNGIDENCDPWQNQYNTHRLATVSVDEPLNSNRYTSQEESIDIGKKVSTASVNSSFDFKIGQNIKRVPALSLNSNMASMKDQMLVDKKYKYISFYLLLILIAIFIFIMILSRRGRERE